MRAIFTALIAYFLLGAIAMACPGQVGKVIFEDNFADDSGGWQVVSATEIKDGSLLLRPNAGGMSETNTTANSTNLTFSAGEGDYCLEFILPKQVAPDNTISAGLLFLQTDINTKYLLMANTNKTVYLYKMIGGQWNKLSESPGADVKLEPDAVNSIRVVAKSNKLTVFLNGSPLKVVRAQMPAGESRFGVYAEAQKSSDANPEIRVKGIKITAGQ